MEYQKIQSVGKKTVPPGTQLDSIVLDTMAKIASVVGATLGPGGRPVIIERYENHLAPVVTKDGVTVFRALGFQEPVAHNVMEVARDASVRTANEAGDGTTTATVLSESLVRHLHELCRDNPRLSPQSAMREIQGTLRDYLLPTLESLSLKVDPSTTDGQKLMHAVASLSANGDTKLADAVMECFQITGDEGNVTITESAGPSRYEVEHIDGYPVDVGYEDSAQGFWPVFVNDVGRQMVVLDKPLFLLYHGQINDIMTVVPLLSQVNIEDHKNVVVVAPKFSDSVLANLAAVFSAPDKINVYPMQVPLSPYVNGQLALLQDLQAVTGAKILDQINAPAEKATVADLGPGVKSFEASRFRSMVIGYADADLLVMRIEELDQNLLNPESVMDGIWLQERKAKLSNGIAKLKVIGSSNAELKERRDRAEDAVCAVRGAIKKGCLPGGGWALLRCMAELPDSKVNNEVLRPALLSPFEKLVYNSGIVTDDDKQKVLGPVLANILSDSRLVYDFLAHKHVDPYISGILDSTPAVVEALRNAISVAGLLGTLGGAVVFVRDQALEQQEALETAKFTRDVSAEGAHQTNEANKRA